jgi:two-component system, OmpR family, sensor kinase
MGELLPGTPDPTGPVGRVRRGLLRDVVVTGGVTGLALAINHHSWVGQFLPQVSVMLALVTAAAAGSAVVTAAAVSRLSADRRVAWVGAGMLLYGLVAVPTTAIGSTFESIRAGIGLTRLTAHALVVIVLLLACRPPRRPRGASILVLFGGTMLIIAAGAGVATVAPGWALAFSDNAAPRYAVAAGWMLAGAVLTTQALWSPGRAPSARAVTLPSARVGVGVGVMALAHLYRIVSEPAQPLTVPGLVFSTARLIGVCLVFLGLVSWALHALGTAREDLAQREEQLRDATTELDRVAHRDRELRNRLARLVGIAGGWNAVAPEEKPQLAATAKTELECLQTLLDHEPRPDPDSGNIDRDSAGISR